MKQYATKPAGSIPSLWEVRTYDVWGNARDGYEVNDSYSHGRHEIRIAQTVYNFGTPQAFVGAGPNDRQIRQVLNCPHVHIDMEGDDLTLYVNRKRDGYPLGELHCVSHESLSPVRLKPGVSRDPKDGWSGV